MRHHPVLLAPVLAALIIAAGCSQKGPPVAELPPPAVTVSQPVEKPVVDQDTYEGHLSAVERVDVRPEVTGLIQEVKFKAGQLVKKGDVLFLIDPRSYKAALDGAKAQKQAAVAAYEFAVAEYNRVEPLVSKGAAAREELDVWKAKQAVAKADAAKADASIETAQADLDRCEIRAKVKGGQKKDDEVKYRVSRALLTEGNLVSPTMEKPLTTLVSVDPIYVYFTVDERALRRYRDDYAKKGGTVDEQEIKKLEIPVSVALEGDKDYTHKGVIDYVDPQVNKSTGTVQVRAVLENRKGLLNDGMRALVRVATGDPHPALLITERAIGTDQTTKYVWVVNAEKVVERRDVQPGRTFDGLIEIKSGLKPKDWVIVNGIQRVRDGMKVAPKEEPMPGSTATEKAG
jgi:RND family efflux transporter MFP subunit